MAKIFAGITGIGSSVPAQVMTNDDWSKLVDTSDEWIKTRTGIAERRIADENTASSDLAYEAAKKALLQAKLEPKDVELIIVATTTPDYPLFPSVAALLQERLGCVNAGGFDLSAACSGFAYAFCTAAQFIENATYKNVLLIGVDTLSKFVDRTDRNVCVLFGDGAGAVVLQPVAEGHGHLGSILGLRGSGAESLIVKAGGSRMPHCSPDSKDQYIYMNGKEVFKFAVTMMGEVTEQAIIKAGLTVKDIDLYIPHQANIRIIDSAIKRLGLPAEKLFLNLERYGNTSAASIPLALDEAYKAGRIKPGQIVAVCGFGAGLTWAANVFRWVLE